MLPGHMIAEFWSTVKQELHKQHHLSEEKADQGVADYRVRLDKSGVGDMIYHKEPADVARAIAGAIKQGGFQVLDPLPTR